MPRPGWLGFCGRDFGQRLAQVPEHLRPANERRRCHTDTPRSEGQLTPAAQRNPAGTRLHTFAGNNIQYTCKLVHQSTSVVCGPERA